MDAEELVESVKEESKTELSRLNSSKNIMAQTNGKIDVETILKESANGEKSAFKTFNIWKKSEKNPKVKQAFENFSSLEEDHLKIIKEEIEKKYSPTEKSPIHDYMRSLEKTETRLGSLIGRSLVSDSTLKQTIVFFVGKGDKKRADIFREMREENRHILEKTKELLNETCENWDAAEREAKKIIQIAYENYAETLEEMGVNPKPVC